MSPRKPSKTRKKEPSRERSGRMWLYALVPVAALLIIAGIWLANRGSSPSSASAVGEATTGAETAQGSRRIELAPASLLTGKYAQAPPVVSGAYRFAIANQDLLSQVPCYCGCGGMGHGSNLDCFMQGVNPDGSIVFDDHAFGWTICVDIARDATQLWKSGKSVAEIRSYVDREYSQYGPSTNTQPKG